MDDTGERTDTTLEFSTVKQLGAVLLAVAIVLAAGTVVGQAPEIFGTEAAEGPTASIEFSDQRGDGTSATIDRVSVSEGGYVAVADETGEIVGVSDYLEPGEHENVTVEQSGGDELRMLGRLTATAHRNTTDGETFAYRETGGEEDPPYVEDGYPVNDVASVTLADESTGPDTTTSFRVESIEGIDAATTNESVGISATIQNPNEFETRQHVDLRLDGAVQERRIVTLSPNETRAIDFEIDLTGVDPGRYTYGVYTSDDGETARLSVELDETPALAIRNATASNVTVDATLPGGGFVALEANGTLVGTTETLEPGTYENRTIALEEPLEGNVSVTAVAYRGDAERPSAAEAYRAGGGPVTASVPIDAGGTDGDDERGEDARTGEE